MNIAPLQAQAQPAADVPAEQLAHNRALTEDQKVAEVSRQFEALLLRQILQEAQKTAIPSKFSDNSTTASIYHDMVTNQLADSISKSGTLGLAQSLQRQLTRQLHTPAWPKPATAPLAETRPGVARNLSAQPLRRGEGPTSMAGPDRTADANTHLPPETDTIRPSLPRKLKPFQTTAETQP